MIWVTIFPLFVIFIRYYKGMFGFLPITSIDILLHIEHFYYNDLYQGLIILISKCIILLFHGFGFHKKLQIYI